MNQFSRASKWGAVVVAAVALISSRVVLSADVDADAAKGLARQNNCFKCHAVEKEKDGPSYKKVAEKYKGKPEAEARLTEHITSGEKAKFPDGHEEEHKVIRAKNEADVKNLVGWILIQ